MIQSIITQTTTLPLTQSLSSFIVPNKKVRKQFSSDVAPISGKQLRMGIYDILQLLRKDNVQLSENLPSDNMNLGIGTKRIAGTGRTAHLVEKRNERNAELYGDFGGREKVDKDLMFLKSARGQEFKLRVEGDAGKSASNMMKG